jgi:hypothetical protein
VTVFQERDVNVLLAVFFAVLVASLFLLPVRFSPGSFPAHLLGIAGSTLMSLTLVYPFRKRIQGKKGIKNPLSAHIFFGLMGPSLVVLHAGHSLASPIGTLTFMLMLTVVLSGVVGRYLFLRVRRGLKQEKRDLETLKRAFIEKRGDVDAYSCRVYFGLSEAKPDPPRGVPPSGDASLDSDSALDCEELQSLAQAISEKERIAGAFSATQSLFSFWKRCHIYLTLLLFALVIVHILTTLYYGVSWLR